MNKKILLVISVILGLLIFGAVALVVDIKDIFNIISSFSLYHFIVLFIVFFVVFLLLLARWGMTLNAMGYPLPFPKLLSFRLAEWSFSYVTPFLRLGGEPVMAYLFKKDGGIRYRKGISTIIINKFLDFAAGLITAIIGVFVLIAYYGSSLTKNTLILIIVPLAILFILVYMFYRKTMRKEKFFSTLLSPFKSLIPHKNLHRSVTIVENHLEEFFKKNKSRIVIMALISLMYQILMLVLYKMIGLSLGINLSILHLLIINMFIVLSLLAPLPGSLGSMEGMTAFAFFILGLGASNGFVFSIILRGFELIIVLIGFFFVYYYGLKLFGDITETINENI